jgi:DNA-binding CsgD family transcriptional regulator
MDENESKRDENPGYHANRGFRSRTRLSAVERRERDHQCVQLRAAGASWEEIAQRLGYSSPGPRP